MSQQGSLTQATKCKTKRHGTSAGLGSASDWTRLLSKQLASLTVQAKGQVLDPWQLQVAAKSSPASSEPQNQGDVASQPPPVATGSFLLNNGVLPPTGSWLLSLSSRTSSHALLHPFRSENPRRGTVLLGPKDCQNGYLFLLAQIPCKSCDNIKQAGGRHSLHTSLHHVCY